MPILFSGCNCHVEGTVNGNECDATSGNCTCLDGYIGVTVQVTCNLCDEGFYNINSGTSNPLTCRGMSNLFIKWKLYWKVHGASFVIFSSFVDAECYTNGTMSTDVDSGNCTCKTGYKGEKCDQCDKGHYDFNDGTDEPLICSGKIILFECID